MRYLFVTTFPPTHCGIAAYANQSVQRLRQAGHWVDAVSPDGTGNVDFAWNLKGGFKVLSLLKLLPFYDRVVIQYHWSFFYRDVREDRFRYESLCTHFAFILLWLFGRKKIQVLAHEIPAIPRASWLSPNWFGYRLKWRLVPQLILHTRREQEVLLQHYRLPANLKRWSLQRHHANFVKFREISREAARRELHLPADAVVFLCIGFIQRHKGSDRAVVAFRQAAPANAQLYIVGSLRYVHEETLGYLNELRALTQTCPTAHFIERFISDEEFDTWISACDWVVLPYREIWSSGVLGRAKLLNRPAIVMRVGGLADQVDDGDILVESEEKLREAFRTAAARSAGSRVVLGPLVNTLRNL